MPALCLGKSSRCALIVVCKDRARTVDSDVVDDQLEATYALTGFANRPAERHARMRQIDETGNIPSWSITGSRNIDVFCQIRILIDGDPAPIAGRRGCDIQSATPARNMLVAPSIRAREDNRQRGPLKRVAVGIQLAIHD